MNRLLTHTWVPLGIILLIAALMRLYMLGNVPISPNWDEASLGYNAYSLLLTGRDEFGNFLPVVLKSFGDYKPALYAYLIIPFIALFDLSTIAVRLPSAIAGIIAVVGTYFLVNLLFKNRAVALSSSFLLAISPWHVQFSRVAFEANVGVTLNILAVLFFLKGLKKGMYLPFSAIFAALSLYTYQSEKIFVPLLFLALVLIYRKELFLLSKKFLIVGIVTGILFSLPLIVFMTTHPESLARAQMTSVISRGDSILERSANRLRIDKERGDNFGQLINNRRVIYAKTVLNGYISHFDPNWLFVTGDMPRHHAPGMGILYLWELPFIIIGVLTLLSLKLKKAKFVVFSWLLLAPVPAALTFDVPHAVRTMNFLPIFQILTGFGIITAVHFLRNKKPFAISYVTSGLALLIFTFSFMYYLNQYFVQQNYFFAKDWQYGYQELIQKIGERNTAVTYYVSSEVPMDQSYIFFLYFLKYSPEQYHREAVHYSGNVDHAFANFVFMPLRKLQNLNEDSRIIGSEKDFPKDVVSEYVVRYPDGTSAMKIVHPKHFLIKSE